MERDTLVKKAKQGDKDALVELIMAQKQDYYKLAYVYLKNQEDALDAMEDMILIVYENIFKLKNEEAFYTWSKTILVNCCKKIIKDNKKIAFMNQVREEISSDNITKKDDEIFIEGHMDKLKEKHKEVIKLRYYLDLDYQSISRILKIPLGTVKSRISIGLKKMKESMGGENYEG